MKIQFILTFAYLLFSSGFSIAQTEVSGSITSDAIWTKANSPYIVTENIIIDSNITLTIEAGVTVKIRNYRYLYCKKGMLVAIGTESDSIRFINELPGGIWQGIPFLRPQKTVRFNFCRISNSEYGIGYQTNGSDSLIIKHCTFTNNESGVFLSDTSGHIIIDSSLFENNTHYGIQANYTNTFKISNCIFKNNQYGLGAFNTNKLSRKEIRSTIFSNNIIGVSALGNTLIENCTFDHNEKAGSSTNQKCLYNKCKFISNKSVMSLKHDTLTNSLIDSNENGIILDSQSVMSGCLLTQNGTAMGTVAGDSNCFRIFENIFERNESAGNIFGGTFTKNVVENNRYGIGVQFYIASPGAIYCNKFCNNTEYNARAALGLLISSGGTPTTDLKNNYWCTTDTALIAKGIRDRTTTPSLVKAYFFPIDETECYKVIPTMMKENKISRSSFSIMPNPATNDISLTGISVDSDIKIYSTDGRLAYDQRTNINNPTISISGLIPGIYIVKIIAHDGKQTFGKFIKQ